MVIYIDIRRPVSSLPAGCFHASRRAVFRAVRRPFSGCPRGVCGRAAQNTRRELGSSPGVSWAGHGGRAAQLSRRVSEDPFGVLLRGGWPIPGRRGGKGPTEAARQGARKGARMAGRRGAVWLRIILTCRWLGGGLSRPGRGGSARRPASGRRPARASVLPGGRTGFRGQACTVLR